MKFQWSLEKCGKHMCSVHHLSTHSCPPRLLERSLLLGTSAPCSVTLGTMMVLIEFLLRTQTYLSSIVMAFDNLPYADRISTNSHSTVCICSGQQSTGFYLRPPSLTSECGWSSIANSHGSTALTEVLFIFRCACGQESSQVPWHKAEAFLFMYI